MNKVYGFEGETKKKYSELTYKLFEEVFCAREQLSVISALPILSIEALQYRSLAS